jgi:PadR family transcriptional regulator PadR
VILELIPPLDIRQERRDPDVVIRQERPVTLPTSDVLQGTLDLLILRTLALQPMHGWGIAQRIQQLSEDVLQVNQGSLYPAVHRLEQKGLIASEWGISENNRRAKYYRLTASGERQLVKERESWERFSGAVRLVLQGG